MRSILLWIAVAVCSLGSAAAVIRSGSSDGFGKRRDTETAISYLENESIASKATMVPLTLIQGADSKGAVCLDGTLLGYHLDRGFVSGANSWLIHLEFSNLSGYTCREEDGVTAIVAVCIGKQLAVVPHYDVMYEDIVDNQASEDSFHSWNVVAKPPTYHFFGNDILYDRYKE
ncbi:unnamed protein product [Thlaspi arvense]|uniref:Pectin acetylesterase n=1 Tax=Thlaspi arvense TaxID=13288 RepID=A0AAU9SXC6_THLAR|nr:unnamed protein product [Thlaspi arvense]